MTSGQAADGKMFVLSAPSGAGKTTLCKALCKRFPSVVYSISYTTRPPRKEERDGNDYHFVSREDFQRGIEAGKWVEWAKVYGHYYGTCARLLDQALGRGAHVLLDIDVQGAMQVLARYPESVTIFIMPPSPEVLGQRLAARGTDDPETVSRRLAHARWEMSQSLRYRYVVVNDKLDQALCELEAILLRHGVPR